ncbi:YicC/YloC family endoribonuclease [Paenibacillus antri]|nr:YicC/YloC family endoribonuclease [Paenibacillus antri]
MLRSMTGYGHDSRSAGNLTFTVDMRSVNHRYSEVACRLPREWSHMEDRLRRLVLARVKRGRVDVSVTVERAADAPRQAAVDWALASAYVDAARQLAERFSLSDGRPSARELLAAPGVWRVAEDAPPDDAGDRLLECAESALAQLVAMREAEGRYLAEDAAGKLTAVGAAVERMRALAPAVADEYRERLRERIASALGAAPVDEQRLAAEIAYFAERSAIDEELTRLGSHAAQFAELLTSGEPVGRKLDFLLQEMNREANTIGSKANHAALSALAVDVKAELEKLREQSQNFE